MDNFINADRFLFTINSAVKILKILKRFLKRYQDPVLGPLLEALWPLRDTNSKTTHYLLLQFLSSKEKALKGSTKGFAADILRLNILRELPKPFL